MLTGMIPLAKAVRCGDIEIRRFKANDGNMYYLATDVYPAMGYKGNYSKARLARVREHITKKYCIPCPGRNARKMYAISEDGMFQLLKDSGDGACAKLFERFFKKRGVDTCQAPAPERNEPEKERTGDVEKFTEKEMYELTIEGLKGALRDKDRRIDILERRVLEYENKALFYSGIKILEKQLQLEE